MAWVEESRCVRVQVRYEQDRCWHSPHDQSPESGQFWRDKAWDRACGLGGRGRQEVVSEGSVSVASWTRCPLEGHWGPE
jgi:hypothetical protein